MTSIPHETSLTLIRDNLTLIMRQLTAAPKAKATNDIKASVSKILNLVLFNNNPIERFYFITLLCKLSRDEDSGTVGKLLKIVLPPNPTPQSIALISDITNFALCHSSEYKTILKTLSSYPNGTDVIKIEMESWEQAEALAINSPYFCSVLLCRRDLPLMNVPTRLLAKWMQDLYSWEDKVFFACSDMSPLIRLSLLRTIESQPCRMVECQPSSEKLNKSIDTSESDLHFWILTFLRTRSVKQLADVFLVEIAQALAQKINKSETSRTTLALDRFGQILSVGLANRMIFKFSSSLKNALSGLSSNQLISAVIRCQEND